MLGEMSYWRESSRPLPSLMFVAPMILVYELGTVILGAEAPRNGADVWLRSLLGQIGLAQHFLLPLLTCGLLLAWHHERWAVSWPVVSGMLIESSLLGLLLLLLANGMASLLATEAAMTETVPQGFSPPLAMQYGRVGRIVGYLGAGIYEELLFRLLLIPPAIRTLQSLGMARRPSWWWAAALTSLLFAMAHYEVSFSLMGQEIAWPGEQWNAVTFGFRTLAGLVFSVLFLLRGFGIAAGAHALYDIFVAIL